MRPDAVIVALLTLSLFGNLALSLRWWEERRAHRKSRNAIRLWRDIANGNRTPPWKGVA